MSLPGANSRGSLPGVGGPYLVQVVVGSLPGAGGHAWPSLMTCSLLSVSQGYSGTAECQRSHCMH